MFGKWSGVARKVSELLSGKPFSFGIFPFYLSFHNWGPSDTFVVNSFLYSFFGDRREKALSFLFFSPGQKSGKLRCGWNRKEKKGASGGGNEIAAAVTMSNHRRGMEREGKEKERSHGIFWGLGIAHFCDFLYFQLAKGIFLNSWYDGRLHFGNWRHLHFSYLGSSYSQVVKIKKCWLIFPLLPVFGTFHLKRLKRGKDLAKSDTGGGKKDITFLKVSPLSNSQIYGIERERKVFWWEIWNGIWNGRKKYFYRAKKTREKKKFWVPAAWLDRAKNLNKNIQFPKKENI